MVQIGVRQLRNGLTWYLRLAAEGRAVLATSRKRPIAVISKPDRVSAQTEDDAVLFGGGGQASWAD